MKYLKTFESFILETSDIMMFPGNYLEDSKKFYDYLIDSVSNIFKKLKTNILESLKLTKEDIEKISNFIKENFGSDTIKLNRNNIEKIIQIFKLSEINEATFDKYARNENRFIKSLVKISEFLGLTTTGLLAIGTPSIFAEEYKNLTSEIAITMAIAIFTTILLNTIVKLYGYSGTSKEIPWTDKKYDFRKDIRNKMRNSI